MVVNIAPNLEKARYFRGKGGEMVRKAVCFLIETIAIAKLEISTKIQVALCEHLNENLRQPHEEIQKTAASALRYLLSSYFSFSGCPSKRLQDLTVQKYLDALRADGNGNVAITRGNAMALGSLPVKLIILPEGRVNDVLNCLSDAARSDRLFAGEIDVETRKNSLLSVTELYSQLAPYIGREVNTSFVDDVVECLVRACDDYTVDNRGDTGSWCRLIALQGLEKVLYDCIKSNHLESAKRANFVDRVLTVTVKQLAEKLDSVREIAGGILERIITSDSPYIPDIYDREVFEIAITKRKEEILADVTDVTARINWSHARDVFRVLVQLLDSSHFFPILVSGWIISIGGLTESIMKESSSTLIGWCRQKILGGEIAAIERLGETFIRILCDFSRQDRVIIPLLKTVDLLLKEGCLIALTDSSSAWVQDFFNYLRVEIQTTSDVKKLVLSVDILLHFLQLHSFDTSSILLKQAVNLLGHKYPRIRKYVSEQLYMLILGYSSNCRNSLQIDRALCITDISHISNPDVVNFDCIMNIISETVWDGKIQDARLKRAKLCQEFHWKSALKDTKSSESVKVAFVTKSDELDSYESLVREAGIIFSFILILLISYLFVFLIF